MNREKRIVKTSIWGIVVNIILVLFKMTVGVIVNSIAIILDAINNLSDALSSVITIAGVKFANKRPDKDHPFGHGRIEYFSSLIIAIIILVAGATSLKESVEKILYPDETNYSIISLIIITVTVFVKLFFGRYVRNVGREINSQSLVASGTDAFMDAVISFSTLVAGILNIAFHWTIEGYLGAAISLIIIKSSIGIMKETFNSIIGERADNELTKNIKEKINTIDGVQGVYDLALHNYGPSTIIGSAHIQVQDDMTAREIHKLTRKIQAIIYTEFGITLTIGIYAANNSDSEFHEIREALEAILKEYPAILQMHGFYGDEETKIITFDLVVDYEYKNQESLKEEIMKRLKAKFPQYRYYVILDRDISD